MAAAIERNGDSRVIEKAVYENQIRNANNITACAPAQAWAEMVLLQPRNS
jgi:hypothetical protein